jgi:uncharacterized membrane protein YiaA
MTWTADSGLAPLVRLFYDQQQIKTFAQELLIVVNTSYYFSLIVIVAFGAASIHRIFASRSSAGETPETNFSSTTKRALVTSFHTFLVFIAFFYFLLRNDGGNISIDLDDLSKRYINLLPFWFLASTVVYLVGEWLARWARLRLSLVGMIMNIVLWLLIAGEIYQNGFIQRALNL